MLEILKSQKDFLDYHNIPLSKVLDATGMRPKDYKNYMKESDYACAIGVSPCAKMGHTLRDGHGHCIQCHPANIAFRNRYYQDGCVYLAGSISKKVIKVGFTNKIDEREESLNEQGYGSIFDWRIIYWIKTIEAGKFEYLIQKELNIYASPRTFIKDGRTNNCLEIFSCSFFKVKETIDDLLYKNMINALDEYINDDLIDKYNFRNKKGNFFYIKGDTKNAQIININDPLMEDEKLFINTEDIKTKKKKLTKSKKIDDEEILLDIEDDEIVLDIEDEKISVDIEEKMTKKKKRTKKKITKKKLAIKEQKNYFKTPYLLIILILLIVLYLINY